MTRLRKSILFTIFYLAIVFNMERWDYQGENPIDIQTFVYVLILAAVLAIIVTRKLQRSSVYFSLILSLSLYVGAKLLVFNTRPLIGDIYTYLTITEVALLTIAIFLAYDLAGALTEFENIIEQVTIPKIGQRIFPLKNSQEEIKTEFARSRRHNRPLSLLVFEMDPAARTINLKKTIKEIQQSMLDRYMTASLAQLISSEARRTDLILEQDHGNGFVILCPETNADGTSVLADRIRGLANERFGLSLNFGLASFPDEALTFDELLQKAQIKMIHAGVFSPIAMESPPTGDDAELPADPENRSLLNRS